MREEEGECNGVTLIKLRSDIQSVGLHVFLITQPFFGCADPNISWFYTNTFTYSLFTTFKWKWGGTQARIGCWQIVSDLWCRCFSHRQSFLRGVDRMHCYFIFSYEGVGLPGWNQCLLPTYLQYSLRPLQGSVRSICSLSSTSSQNKKVHYNNNNNNTNNRMCTKCDKINN